MSDPVTNIEIEDVLSSIRRLVSAAEEPKAQAKPQEIKAFANPPKFVLTPALRVTDPDDLIESKTDHAASMPLSDAHSVVSDKHADAVNAVINKQKARDSLEATIAELEAAVVNQRDEWEPDGSEIKSVPTWETVSYPPLDEVEDAIAIEETSPADMRGSPVPDAEPDGDDIEEQVADKFHAILTNGPMIAEDAAFSEDDPLPTLENADRFSDDHDVETLTFTRSQPIPLPEEAADDYGDELAPDPVPASEDEDLDAYMLTSGQGINEEALRQLVMNVVREELQGDLGERITRNVRKMVRREIHRALDMQDFD